MKKRFLWQIYPVFLVITILGLAAVSWSVKNLIRISYENEKKVSLERLAGLGIPSLSALLDSKNFAEIQHLCEQMDSIAHVRYTVIDPAGKILGDSRENPEQMVNHFQRPEFQTALKGHVGSQVRSSETLQQKMMYVAIPIDKNGEVVAVLRTSVAITELQDTLRLIDREIVRYALIITLILALLSLGFSWKIARPLERLRQGAEHFARGDLHHRLEVPPSNEIGFLAESLNAMAAQLDERIRTISAQKNEQQAVLSSMIEGLWRLTQTAASSA